MKRFFAESVLVGLCLMLTSGCVTKVGANVKKGAVDAGVGVAVVATLEAVDESKFEATKTNIIIVASDLLAFIDTGCLGDLPFDQAQTKLNNYLISKGYAEYTYLVTIAFKWVESQSIDVSVIGKNNVELLKIAFKETIVNANYCTLAGRTTWKAASTGDSGTTGK